MIILQVIDFSNLVNVFIRVEPKYHNLVKRINERYAKEDNEDIRTLSILLGRAESTSLVINPRFGTKVTNPISCTEFYSFYYYD